MSNSLRIFLGWDSREAQAYAVAARSIRARTSRPVEIQSISMQPLVDLGMYRRPTERRDGRLWDCISAAPCSTEHAIARFWVPILCNFEGWALFADCDILCRADITQLFALANPAYAVQVVKHDYQPTESQKMDAQTQQPYPKKLWSSVALYNCGHPAHRMLKWSDYVNLWPGRDLHAFRWMWEDQIGELPHEWNHLVGIDAPNPNAKIVHFTLGDPSIPGYEDCEFSDEWRDFLRAEVVA